MPTPDSDPILPSARRRYSFSAEPAHNAIYSLHLLTKVDAMPGVDGWVTRMATQLSPERQHHNRVIINGLHYALVPRRSFPSFMAYLDDLATSDPYELRDRITEGLWPALRPSALPEAPPPPQQPADILASADSYLDFLRFHFAGLADLEMEAEAYELMANPPRMREAIVRHLRTMWSEGLGAEWERARPLVQESAQAFRSLDLSAMEPEEAARAVLGQDLDEGFCGKLRGPRTIIFVPSPHLGPYVGKLDTADHSTLWVFFGARLPAGVDAVDSDLTRSELLVRLGALTDDARLQVLGMLAREDELCASELMARLDLSQSAVSRHLRQLVAAGYVSERWRDGSKCYRLSRARVSDTLRALGQFLGDR
jgi:DNA-binding transcriptional ArsR family regulator